MSGPGATAAPGAPAAIPGLEEWDNPAGGWRRGPAGILLALAAVALSAAGAAALRPPAPAPLPEDGRTFHVVVRRPSRALVEWIDARLASSARVQVVTADAGPLEGRAQVRPILVPADQIPREGVLVDACRWVPLPPGRR